MMVVQMIQHGSVHCQRKALIKTDLYLINRPSRVYTSSLQRMNHRFLIPLTKTAWWVLFSPCMKRGRTEMTQMPKVWSQCHLWQLKKAMSWRKKRSMHSQASKILFKNPRYKDILTCSTMLRTISIMQLWSLTLIIWESMMGWVKISNSTLKLL